MTSELDCTFLLLANMTRLNIGVVLEDLDPIIVRVVDERNVPHPSLLWSLLELDAEVVEAFARGVEVVDRDADVSESPSGLLISVGVALEARVRFCYQPGDNASEVPSACVPVP